MYLSIEHHEIYYYPTLNPDLCLNSSVNIGNTMYGFINLCELLCGINVVIVSVINKLFKLLSPLDDRALLLCPQVTS